MILLKHSSSEQIYRLTVKVATREGFFCLKPRGEGIKFFLKKLVEGACLKKKFG